MLNPCSDCCYCWADVDDEGRPVSREYCHYPYDDGYAPCEIDDRDHPDKDPLGWWW